MGAKAATPHGIALASFLPEIAKVEFPSLIEDLNG